MRIDSVGDVTDFFRRDARVLDEPELGLAGGTGGVVAEVAEPPSRPGDGDVREVDGIEDRELAVILNGLRHEGRATVVGAKDVYGLAGCGIGQQAPPPPEP